MNIAMTKVYFQAPHHSSVNKFWPDFYFFMTSTSIALLPDGQKRVRDGLIYSEFNFRQNPNLSIMEQKVQIAANVTVSEQGLQSGLAYSDSKILTANDPSQQAWNRTLVIHENMRVVGGRMEEKSTSYGSEWIDKVDICKSDIDYSKIWSIGMTDKQLVSHMDPQQSTE